MNALQSVEKWDTFALCNWLGKNGFDKYVEAFSKHDIDGEMLLRDVTDDHLMNDCEMSFLKVKSLRRKIEELNRTPTGDAADGRDADSDDSANRVKPGEKW